MIVYHGSIQKVEKPDLAKGRKELDFGVGFYVTTKKDQAEKWSKRKATPLGKKGIVNVYAFDAANLSIKKFDGYNKEWLDYIILNRDKGTTNDYDVIFGNIADDEVATAVSAYIRRLKSGRATEIQYLALMDELSFAIPNDQYCIKTEKALAHLKFRESYEVQ